MTHLEPSIPHASHASSASWWEAIKHDPAAFTAWLLDQYRGETTAGERIERLRDAFAKPGERAHRVLTVIAAQERRHASWVAELLRARGIEPVVDEHAEERYWRHAIAGIADLETGCAVGAHAEKMRLERIETIAHDPESPEDVRAVFAKILPEEHFHERAFRHLATPEALDATREQHELGRTALGLAR